MPTTMTSLVYHPLNCIGILALGLLLWGAPPAHAITYTFVATVADDSLFGYGSFTFDENIILDSEDGSGIINPNSGLTLEFTIFGQEFNETDDADYNPTLEFPFLLFDHWALYQVSFQVSADKTLIHNPLVEGFFVGLDLTLPDPGDYDFSTELTVDYKAAPNPGTLILLLFGVGVLRARRRASR